MINILKRAFNANSGMEAMKKVIIDFPERFLSKVKPEQRVGKRIIKSPKELVQFMSDKVPFHAMLKKAKSDEELIKIAEFMIKANSTMKDDFLLDDSYFPWISTDNMCINVGLIIFRLPIYFHMEDYEFKWMQERLKYERKYIIDKSKYYEQACLYGGTADEFRNVILKDRTFHPDNNPTHRYRLPNGEFAAYAFGSKQFDIIDPCINDPHCIHYAGDNRVYFLVKSKETKQWSFPTRIVSLDGGFNNSRDKLLESISHNSWKVKYFPITPLMCKVEAMNEKDMQENNPLLIDGSRTYYVLGVHDCGMPVNHNEKYSDFAWVPKIELQKYLTESEYNRFVGLLLNR
jgi:hypothetical protein